ncbi:hypothetical protein Pyn_23824 [Prunus yedoensis var. nudiflora]|uniref:Uncharacterized protein n=1 Tax=Prunus yedoensis var. nudiflora TaxID=2094558 RepID=A0A314YZK7_PRUYE|nr:hypothetical protein Pyn_23824 [Prunus yedoensis var. nudiflora]
MTYDTLEGKDSSPPSVRDKRREDHNNGREKPDDKKGRFENSRQVIKRRSSSISKLSCQTPDLRGFPKGERIQIDIADITARTIIRWTSVMNSRMRLKH